MKDNTQTWLYFFSMTHHQLCSGERLQSAGSAKGCANLRNRSAEHLKPTIHVHVFSTHVYSGGDPIKLTHEPFTDANGPRVSRIHTCRCLWSPWRKDGWPEREMYIIPASEKALISGSTSAERQQHNGSRAWKPREWTFKTIPAFSKRGFGEEDKHAHNRWGA